LKQRSESSLENERLRGARKQNGERVNENDCCSAGQTPPTLAVEPILSLADNMADSFSEIEGESGDREPATDRSDATGQAIKYAEPTRALPAMNNASDLKSENDGRLARTKHNADGIPETEFNGGDVNKAAKHRLQPKVFVLPTKQCERLVT
jgi:hypothetical protein